METPGPGGSGIKMALTTGGSDRASSASENSPGQDEFAERRSGQDRRNRPTSPLQGFLRRGRRRSGRRKGETERTYVDSFTPGDVALLLAIFVLNIFDALFTLLWLQRGGGEANPFMAFLLDMGQEAFLLQKCIVVGIWLIVLLIHKNFRLARIGLYSLAGIYTLIIATHFVLMAGDVDPRHPIEISLPGSEETGQERGQSGFYPKGSSPEADSI